MCVLETTAGAQTHVLQGTCQFWTGAWPSSCVLQTSTGASAAFTSSPVGSFMHAHLYHRNLVRVGRGKTMTYCLATSVEPILMGGLQRQDPATGVTGALAILFQFHGVLDLLLAETIQSSLRMLGRRVQLRPVPQVISCALATPPAHKTSWQSHTVSATVSKLVAFEPCLVVKLVVLS